MYDYLTEMRVRRRRKEGSSRHITIKDFYCLFVELVETSEFGGNIFSGLINNKMFIFYLFIF